MNNGYVKTKLHRSSLKPSIRKTSRILELVHTHICGPVIPATSSGYRYVMIMSDDCSGFTKLYLLRDKSETTKKREEYLAEKKSQFDREPEVMRTDKAERYSQTLITKTRCMLNDANLGKEFWGEAIMTANYQLNREPDKVSNRTPFEMWYDTRPKFSDLSVFGSVAMLRVPCGG